MLEQIFSLLEVFDDSLWGFIGFPAIILMGLILSFESNFVQVRKFPVVVKTFFGYLFRRKATSDGVSPLKAFFACVGGCVGLGNVVGICTAIKIGGPGALFWIWITAVLGMIVKYAEVYLGVRYRVSNLKGGYNGGPMFFLQQVFKTKAVPNFICFLLCIYGVEVFQFSIVTNSLTHNFELNQYAVIAFLLTIVIFAGSGGVQRVGSISSYMVPIFVTLYVSMGIWILFQNYQVLPEMIHLVFSSAFTEASAVGGFAGSAIILTISQGIRRGCYTGDVGIGYASVIHSETSAQRPEKQASLVIFDIFIDTIVICTTSVMIILSTGVWTDPIPAELMIQAALTKHFPYVHLFMPLFIFLLGISTINAFFCVGLKCAEHLAPRRGRAIFYVYSTLSLIVFSFVDASKSQIFMSIIGGLLLMMNLYGIFRLRHEICYDFDGEDEVKVLRSDRLPEMIREAL